MTTEAKTWRLVALVAMGLLLVLAALRLVSSLSRNMGDDAVLAPVLPVIAFETVRFEDLAGWETDEHGKALPAMRLSCAHNARRDSAASFNSVEALGLADGVSLSGTVGDWQQVCAAAAEVAPEGARQFFEEMFVPVRIEQPGEDEDGVAQMQPRGRFTGYFEPAYRASRGQTQEFSAPVLARPDDLVMVDLGAFRDELAGKRIAGSVKQGRLVPYADHESISVNGLDTDVLAWMDPNDLLFLQIQGSGRLLLDDGELRVGYAAQNGHEYTAIGGPLIRSGAIAREDISMQAIYEWLEAATPEEAAALRHQNASYVFFRELDNLPMPELGPLGAQGVQLSAGRSLAVDRRYHAMGAPIWIDLPAANDNDAPLQRLMIAQDTGGAIKGPVRGDVYIGSGREAGALAGKFNRLGALYVLLPKQVVAGWERGNAETPS